MQKYIDRHVLSKGLIPAPPRRSTDITIVIPSYDEPGLLNTIQSLYHCDRRNLDIEVIVVVNHPVSAPESVKHTNQTTIESLTRWSSIYGREDFPIYPIRLFDVPHKKRGVGFARKIGMDEALVRYEMVGNNQGIIAAFDADAHCALNYLQAIAKAFQLRPEIDALSIYFEHPMSGDKYPEAVYQAIYQYELHLRYYVQAVRWTGHPQGWHTVGSSMAVRAQAYAQMGGMNRRQAGEDFYFLHKYSAVGRLGLLADTVVYPSPRVSDKVPFGTGRAIGNILRTGTPLDTYHPDAFLEFKQWLGQIHYYFDQPETVRTSPPIKSFLQIESFDTKLEKLLQNTASKSTFIRRFYQVFDAFFVMKWLHYYRDHYQSNIPVVQAATKLLEWKSISCSPTQLLETYRALDREEYR